jgi:hypothetical protein
MNKKLSKISEKLYLNYNLKFHHNHPQMCLYMIKKKLGKKDKKG